MSVFEQVRLYHEVHGDDISEASRPLRYKAIRRLLPAKSGKTLLDVGCGTRQFRKFVPHLTYTGIDLLEGTNVLDYELRHDYVIANGLVYKLPSQQAARDLILHCWDLADEALIWTSLDKWAHFHVEELTLCPYDSARWARRVAGAGKVALDMSYKPGDFCIAMYK